MHTYISQVAAGTAAWDATELLKIAHHALHDADLPTLVMLREVDMPPRVLNELFKKKHGLSLNNEILHRAHKSGIPVTGAKVDMMIYFLDHGVHEIAMLSATNIAREDLWTRIVKVQPATHVHDEAPAFHPLYYAVSAENLIAVQQLCRSAWGRTMPDTTVHCATRKIIELADPILAQAMLREILTYVPNAHAAHILNLAVGAGYVEVVKVILAGTTAWVNHHDGLYHGQLQGYPLWNAVLGGHVEITKLLLAAGADVNIAGESYYAGHGTLVDIRDNIKRDKLKELHCFSQEAWDLVLSH